jgi:C-terminal processing protease CtpA/Prc
MKRALAVLALAVSAHAAAPMLSEPSLSGLGKVVGEPTSGWIIYTSNNDLIDGTIFRLPFTTITTEKGEPMELHPRPVDVPVTRAFGEDAAGTDSQVNAAVRVWMKSEV